MTTTRNPVFDYRALRLLMGIVALSLPLVVNYLAPDTLTSISASYCHDRSRDAFVGSLFAVSAFFFAYRGHTDWEARLSTVACIAALLVAVFPTGCRPDIPASSVVIHRVAAVTLFGILAYIAWFSFRKRIKGKSGKKRFRSAVYMTSAIIIVGCILAALAAWTIDGSQTLRDNIVYWAETIALITFGVAWIVSGKFTHLIADEDELYRVFGPAGQQSSTGM